MKVGIIIGSMGFGGAERVISILSEYWVAHHHSVIIFTTMPKPEQEYAISNGVDRVECNGGGKFSTIKRLRQEVDLRRPDVVLIMDTPMCAVAVPALLGLNIPFIVSERSSPTTKAIKFSTRVISHFLMNFADGFVFQTNGAKEYYNSKIQKRSTVIPNPLKVDNIPTPFEGIRDNRIIAVGRLIPAKNYPLLINAFIDFRRKHECYTLEIYGDGELKKNLTELINGLDASEYIKLMGSREDVLETVRNAAIFVLSSAIEGMPNALIEAMAMGMPCVSTDCPSGGPADLIKHGENGLLVESGNKKELAAAMSKLADDEVYAHRIGKKAVEIRERLTIDVIGKLWLEFMERCK